ncbi:hypothetical protein M747DRAFT_292805, partial [Aspergillus niger ATCC 13496]
MPSSEMPICLGIFLSAVLSPVTVPSTLLVDLYLFGWWLRLAAGQQQQQRGCGDPVPACPCCPCCPSPVQLTDRAASEPGQPYVTVYYGRKP